MFCLLEKPYLTENSFHDSILSRLLVHLVLKLNFLSMLARGVRRQLRVVLVSFVVVRKKCTVSSEFRVA